VRAFASAARSAFHDRNGLIGFLEDGPEDEGEVCFSFRHELDCEGYRIHGMMHRDGAETPFPWDSATSLLHDLSFALIESRGDGLYFPAICNAVDHALAVELQDATIDAAARDRLLAIRAQVIDLRERFRAELRRETRLELAGKPVLAREAFEAWFYCAGHPLPASPDDSPGRQRVKRVADLIRDRTPAGAGVRLDGAMLLLILAPDVRILGETITAWLDGGEFDPRPPKALSRDELLVRAGEPPRAAR
jgi:hypothetical protein